MDAAKALQALQRADTLIEEIEATLNATPMKPDDPDGLIALELQFLTLRTQVEITRKELAIYEHDRCAPRSIATAGV